MRQKSWRMRSGAFLLAFCLLAVMWGNPAAAEVNSEGTGQISLGESTGNAGKQHTVRVRSQNTKRGTVSGVPKKVNPQGSGYPYEDTYPHGCRLTVTAKAKAGYTFSGWYENGALVYRSSPYSFYVNSARALEARFASSSSSSSAGGSSGGSSSGFGGSSGGGSARLTSGNVDRYGSVNIAVIKSQMAKALAEDDKAGAVVEVKNASIIAASVLKGLGEQAEKAGKSAVVRAVVTDSDNKKVIGRFYLDPAALKDGSTDIKLGLQTEGTGIRSVKAKLEKQYDNKLTAIRLSHTGGFGARIRIGVYADISKLDATNLRFYSYNASTGNCGRIEQPEYTVSGNGYLQFYTERGGYIIICEGPLKPKGQNTK